MTEQKKSKYMEAYEKYHAKLLDFRERKGQLAIAQAFAETADKAAADYMEMKLHEIETALATAQACAKKQRELAVLEADRMREEPQKTVETLQGEIKAMASWLRNQEDRLDALRIQEYNEVASNAVQALFDHQPQPPQLRCVDSTFGDGELLWDDVKAFETMCQSVFGEVPQLRECEPHTWYLVDENNALCNVVLEPAL